MKPEKPYLLKRRVEVDRLYNKNYGDDRLCECGHPYYRHFDSYDNNEAVGCKYCICRTFKEARVKSLKNIKDLLATVDGEKVTITIDDSFDPLDFSKYHWPAPTEPQAPKTCRLCKAPEQGERLKARITEGPDRGREFLLSVKTSNAIRKALGVDATDNPAI